MTKPLAVLLRCLGFNRPEPKTPLGRHLRRAERALTVTALLYAGAHFFPQVLFAHSNTAEGITVYSRTPLPAEASQCLKRAAALVQKSELAVPGRRERVFICNSPWLFKFFKPRAGGFAGSVPLTDHVFIAQADFTNDVARWSAPKYNSRSLSSVIAHEITHGLIRHRLGLIRGILLPDWLGEGYADYVARESSFPEAEGLRRMVSGERHNSPAYRYFEYRQMVRYLLEVRQLSFAQAVTKAGDAAAVQQELRQWLQTRPSPGVHLSHLHPSSSCSERCQPWRPQAVAYSLHP